MRRIPVGKSCSNGLTVPRKVVFLFGHLHKGGMQKVASDLSLGLPGAFEIAVAYFGSEIPDFPYRAQLVDLGCSGMASHSVGKRLLNTCRRLIRLQRFVRSWRADVVVSFGEIANALNLLTWGKRTVLSVHAPIDEELSSRGWYGRTYRWIVRTLYRRADAIVTVSDGLAESLVRRYGIPKRTIRAIHNMCALATVRRLAREPVDEGMARVLSSPTVISIGSLLPAKGQDILIRAFGLARREIPTLRLLLVGDGPFRQELEEQAASLGLCDAVHFVGHVANPYSYLARSSIFVSASYYEGFGLALLEAMACGVPVISTDCRFGPREILGEPPAGILVPDPTAYDPRVVEEAISRAIIALATSPVLRASYARSGVARSEAFGGASQLAAWHEVLIGR